jgi:hypothetical protein
MRSEKPIQRTSYQGTLRSPKSGLRFSAVGLISSIDHHVCGRPSVFHVTTPFLHIHGNSMGKKGEKMGPSLQKKGEWRAVAPDALPDNA